MATGPLRRILRHLHRSARVGHGATPSDAELLARYAARRDEGAFEALLHRHGPLVLGVCRRVLGNEADAEDAFQATFLVLVRKGASVRSPGTVAGWLHGVARNVARKARARAARRRAVEREAGALPRPQAPREPDGDVRAVLDEELARLSEPCRVVLVLCDLEGQTIREAARQLGWPPGTAATRLRRGRALLARRLERRGLALPAAVASVAGASGAAPAHLVESTRRIGQWFADGRPGPGSIPGSVADLTAGVLRTMYLTKLKSAALVAAAICVCLGLGGASLWRSWAADAPAPPPAKPVEKPADNLRNTLLALDRHLWEASARGDWQERAKFYADDLVTISILGKYGKADNVAADRRTRCSDWNVEDAEVVRVSKDVAVLSYRYGCKILSADGRLLETRKNWRCNFVWANRNGGWVIVFVFDDHGRGTEPPVRDAKRWFGDLAFPVGDAPLPLR